MKFNKQARIGIIGAGAAGLTAGHYLKKMGYENITVLEKDGRIGGKCCSITYQGKSFDLGANYITSSYTEVKKLARQYGTAMYTEGPLHAFDDRTNQFVSLLKAVTAGSSMFKLFLQAVKYTWLRIRLKKVLSAKHPGFKHISRYPQLTGSFRDWLTANKLQALAPVFSIPLSLMGYGDLDEVPAAYALTFMQPGTFIDLVMAALSPKILGSPKRFTLGYERLLEKISWELEVFTNVDIQSIRRTQQLEVDCMVQEQRLNTMVTVPATFTFDYLIAAAPFPIFISLLQDATPEEKELANLVQVNPYVVTTYDVPSSDKLFACTFSLPEPMIGEPYVVTRQFSNSNLVSFYTRYRSDQPIPKEKILANNKLFAQKMKLTLPDNYVTYSTWAYFPHVSGATMQAGFYDRLEALQGQHNIYYTGGLFAFELVEPITEYSKALINQHF